MRLIFYVLLILIFISPSNELLAQKKLVIMGSSSAAGYGAGVYDSAWGGRITHYYNQNTSDGLDTNVINIAQSGYGTYHEMSTGFTPAIPGRPLPDPNHNVTKALSYNPDVVIINLPSNDVAFYYAKKETMDNFRSMYQTIVSAGAKCYISTCQPRDDFSSAQRDSLLKLNDSINNNFGLYAINFWADLVTNDGLYGIRPEVSAGDAIHVNALGHYYLYLRVLAKQIFADNFPLPLRLLDFRAMLQNNMVTVKWQTADEESNTFFDVQRSADGLNFESINRQQGSAPGGGTSYTWTDQHPLNGKSYYRLKFTETNRSSYSKIVSVANKISQISIVKLYKLNASTLVAEVNSQKSQDATITIINITGEIILKQSQYVTSPSKTIVLPIDKLSSGQYFLRMQIPSGDYALKAFTK